MRPLAVLAAVAALFGAGGAAAQGHPGETLYRTHCAACHDSPEQTRSPARATLSKMRYAALNFALTKGKMQAQGAALTDETRAQLISYLTGRSADAADTWTGGMACDARRAPVNLKAPPTIATFGFDGRNSRSLTAAQAKLDKASLSRLGLAWAIGFPEATTMRTQPAVVGDNVFLPVAEAGALYAFDVSDPQRPCIQWIYRTAGAPLRTSPAYGVLADGRPVLAFSGEDASVHLVDARRGKGLWTRDLSVFSHTQTTGVPRVLKDRVIVPVSQFEISVAADNAHPCCTNHGLVFSLDPKDGSTQWRYDTLPDAKPVRDRGDGKMLLGPSGAPIWNSPVVDEKRGLIYFGTGEANSPPAHRNTDALIAIRLKDGTEAWSFHATENDIFNTGCGPNPKPEQLNCVKDTVYRDVDFGASVILGKLSDGRELLFAGQKSGTVWALEPATGKLVWRRDIGTGGPLGGIHWGIALEGDTLFVPIAQIGRPLPGHDIPPEYTPGLYAVDGRTGAVKWIYNARPNCDGGRDKKVPRCERMAGFSAAPAVVDGTVVQGGLDGMLYVIDGATGKELWRFDTLREFETVNGVPAAGGSIDSAAVSAGAGLVFVGSGYGRFGQVPGNVFLAFRPRP